MLFFQPIYIQKGEIHMAKPVNYRDSDTGRYLSPKDAAKRDQRTVEKEQRKPAPSKKK